MVVARRKPKAPPALSSRSAWLHECVGGGIAGIAGNEVLKAFDYWRGDPRLSGLLMDALMVRIAGLLRRHISRQFPGGGLDMIEAATLVITGGLLGSGTSRYRSMRKNFHHFIRFRALDQLAKYDYKLPDATKGTGPAAVDFQEYNDATLTRLAGDCADDATDIVDVMRVLRDADTRTKAAIKMHFIDGDSLDDTALALGTNRTEVTAWLQPMLEIRNGRGGRGARI